MALESDNVDATIFCGLLDGHFNAGTPRRHAPGTKAGEEEVLLEPSAEVLDFLLGPPPEMVRAVRPKLDNRMPVRQRQPKDIVGHRLEIRQVIGEDRETIVLTTYFVHLFGELVLDLPPQLRRRRVGEEDRQYERRVLPPSTTYGISEVWYSDLGPLRSYDHNEVLSSPEITDLFRFIGSCTCRAPREFE